MIIGSIQSLEKIHRDNGRAYWRINYPELFGRSPTKGLIKERAKRNKKKAAKQT